MLENFYGKINQVLPKDQPFLWILDGFHSTNYLVTEIIFPVNCFEGIEPNGARSKKLGLAPYIILEVDIS